MRQTFLQVQDMERPQPKDLSCDPTTTLSSLGKVDMLFPVSVSSHKLSKKKKKGGLSSSNYSTSCLDFPPFGPRGSDKRIVSPPSIKLVKCLCYQDKTFFGSRSPALGGGNWWLTYVRFAKTEKRKGTRKK